MVILKRLTFLGFICLILTACHLVSRTPTPQPTTSLPITGVSTPILPILPTPTISPLTVLAKYLENPRIVEMDTFDNPSGWNPINGISGGQLLLTGLGDNNWHGLSNRAILREGDGVVINFQFTSSEYFEMYFERGPWPTGLYKRFGLYVNGDHSNADIFVGRQRSDPSLVPGNLSLQPGKWYSLLMVVGRGGDFLAVLWDPANPDESLQYREAINTWAGLEWTFRIQTNQGTILFDNFEEILFDGIR